ncbi:AI-2E family transporter [Halococcus dombrowskii]|uniref:AI-2E family transporter n=1 Tax=Halococcus dombrowskii TaxID=179637 RepID=A0AAV3SB59_HALDO|nr:AI-2E family transporter [Halococcus dombrowskii]UOO94389.1 AI-2E family transporter [Halococcus dombrowskii]
MSERALGPLSDRTRLGWWLFIVLLTIVAAFLAYSFVGMIVLGVFGYYATRPVNRRLRNTVDSNNVAASITVLVVVVPILLLIGYVGFNLFQQLQQAIGTGGPATFGLVDLSALPAAQRETVTTLLRDPAQFISQPQQTLQTVVQLGGQVVGAVGGGIVFLGLVVALSFFLLQNDVALSRGLRELFGGRDTTAYAYAIAIDEDLESVFFGNLLFVVAMSVISVSTYEITNLLAPEALHVPMVLVLGVLTGIASLIPIVVGKVIYLPIVAYLGFQAVRSSGSLLFVGAALVTYFLILDILPQTFLQPYITGRQLDMLVLMFGYILGPILFGWYGFFLLPIVFVLMLEAIRIVLPELIHGEELTPDVSIGEGVGTDPRSARETPTEEMTDSSPENDDTTTD